MFVSHNLCYTVATKLWAVKKLRNFFVVGQFSSKNANIGTESLNPDYENITLNRLFHNNSLITIYTIDKPTGITIYMYSCCPAPLAVTFRFQAAFLLNLSVPSVLPGPTHLTFLCHSWSKKLCLLLRPRVICD